MAISAKLKELLAAHQIQYTTQKHPVAYTAQEIAAALHVPGRQLAKCVLVNTDRGCSLAVLPASRLIDFKRLRKALGAKKLSLAKEADIKQAFPDIEVGAMSPFGNLYNVPVIVEKTLTECETIACNAGTHTETLTLRYRDVAALVKPRSGAFLLEQAKPAATSKKTSAKKKPAGRKAKPARKAKPTKKKTARRR